MRMVTNKYLLKSTNCFFKVTLWMNKTRNFNSNSSKISTKDLIRMQTQLLLYRNIETFFISLWEIQSLQSRSKKNNSKKNSDHQTHINENK